MLTRDEQESFVKDRVRELVERAARDCELKAQEAWNRYEETQDERYLRAYEAYTRGMWAHRSGLL